MIISGGFNIYPSDLEGAAQACGRGRGCRGGRAFGAMGRNAGRLRGADSRSAVESSRTAPLVEPAAWQDAATGRPAFHRRTAAQRHRQILQTAFARAASGGADACLCRRSRAGPPPDAREPEATMDKHYLAPLFCARVDRRLRRPAGDRRRPDAARPRRCTRRCGRSASPARSCSSTSAPAARSPTSRRRGPTWPSSRCRRRTSPRRSSSPAAWPAARRWSSRAASAPSGGRPDADRAARGHASARPEQPRLPAPAPAAQRQRGRAAGARRARSRWSRSRAR